jgi:hypothetical protein
MRCLWAPIVTFGLAVLIVVGCGPQRGESAVDGVSVASPTWAAVPTYTATPMLVERAIAPVATTVVAHGPPVASVITPTGAVEPEPVTAPNTATHQSPAAEVVDSAPAQTATPDSAALLTVTADLVNVRRGPGVVYEQIGVAVQNRQFPLTGRNESGDCHGRTSCRGRPGKRRTGDGP